MIQITQLLTTIFLNQVKFPERNLLFASPCPRKSSSIPPCPGCWGIPGHSHFWAAFFSVNADFLRTLVAEEGNINSLSWDFGMSGHPLKIRVLKTCCGNALAVQCWDSAFTAMVQSLVGKQRSCKLHSVAKKKKKKVLQILVRHS